MVVELRIELKNGEEIARFLKERPERTRQELNRAIQKTVMSVERESKVRAPVKTGRLRASIQAQEFERELKGEVVAGVRYAIFLEFGTRFIRAREFMGGAVKSLTKAIRGYFIEAIENVLKK